MPLSTKARVSIERLIESGDSQAMAVGLCLRDIADNGRTESTNVFLMVCAEEIVSAARRFINDVAPKVKPVDEQIAHCSYGPLQCDECAAQQPDGVEMSCADYDALMKIQASTAEEIDRLLHLQEHEQISTEAMLDGFAALRNRLQRGRDDQRD